MNTIFQRSGNRLADIFVQTESAKVNRREFEAATETSPVAASDAASPALLYEAGLRHLQAGEYLDAQRCCQQALMGVSNHATSLILGGGVAPKAAHYDLAVEWFARAIRREAKPEFLASL